MRYKIIVEYDGTGLVGWQRQLDGPSAQQYLEEALAAFAGPRLPKPSISTDDINSDSGALSAFSGSPAQQLSSASTGSLLSQKCSTNAASLHPYGEISGAGRTDAGVHALAQVAHFDLDKEMAPFKIREAFNANLRLLNAPVSVINVEEVPADFHARFSAKGRGYIYRILNRRASSPLLRKQVWWVPVPLDVEKMRQAAAVLIGHHDFTSFRASVCQAKSPLKTLDKLEIATSGEEIIFTVEARSFLHHQVRNMVGTLKMVGTGQWQPEKVKQILDAKDRAQAGPTAPACGLYLNKVWY